MLIVSIVSKAYLNIRVKIATLKILYIGNRWNGDTMNKTERDYLDKILSMIDSSLEDDEDPYEILSGVYSRIKQIVDKYNNEHNIMSNGGKDKDGIRLYCTQEDCSNHKTGWIYKGLRRYPGYTCCSVCHWSIRITKQ